MTAMKPDPEQEKSENDQIHEVGTSKKGEILPALKVREKFKLSKRDAEMLIQQAEIDNMSIESKVIMMLMKSVANDDVFERRLLEPLHK